MSRYALPLAALLALASCDGAAIIKGDTSGGIVSEAPLPGTANPTPATGITRYEEKDVVEGNGFAQSFEYNKQRDTFKVDNLAFDGADSEYTRITALTDLDHNTFRVYEGPATYPDDVTGVPIDQLLHRALLGTSTSGKVEFAIVRTGSYVNYGFGGFVYSRKGNVSIPTKGQAQFTGSYQGLRDFKGRGGIEYVTGDMLIDIDFEDFNDGDAVKGSVSNRKIYNVAGDDITASVVTALGGGAVLPTLKFVIGPGHVDGNGEISGNVASDRTDSGIEFQDGDIGSYENGTYYALLSGNAVNEVVGVIVVTAPDPRFPSVTVRETGGFILTRP